MNCKVENLATNCVNLKNNYSQSVEQCHKDRQMLAELHDKYQLLRLDKGDFFPLFNYYQLTL